MPDCSLRDRKQILSVLGGMLLTLCTLWNLLWFSHFSLLKLCWNYHQYTFKKIEVPKDGFHSSPIEEPFLVAFQEPSSEQFLKEPFFLSMKNISNSKESFYIIRNLLWNEKVPLMLKVH